MDKLRFDARDAELLYSFPKPPADLQTIVWCFTFLNRAAPPTYDELAGCLARGLGAGIVKEVDGKFFIEDRWYEKIHARDQGSANEMESLLDFEDWFIGMEHESVASSVHGISKEDYDSIINKIH